MRKGERRQDGVVSLLNSFCTQQRHFSCEQWHWALPLCWWRHAFHCFCGLEKGHLRYTWTEATLCVAASTTYILKATSVFIPRFPYARFPAQVTSQIAALRLSFHFPDPHWPRPPLQEASREPRGSEVQEKTGVVSWCRPTSFESQPEKPLRN